MPQVDSSAGRQLRRPLEEGSGASRPAFKSAGPAYSPSIYTQSRPQPVGGCDVCAALDKQRQKALEDQDWSKATDCNVEINKHPHEGRP